MPLSVNLFVSGVKVSFTLICLLRMYQIDGVNYIVYHHCVIHFSICVIRMYIKGATIMILTAGEKIRVILNRKNMSVSDLAQALGQSRQNMSNKLARDNFTEKELTEIAAALGCTYETVFTLNDTKETI